MPYEWRGVLAGAYANDKAMARMVAHLVDVETGAVLCGRVKPERMCDIPSGNEKHCPLCEKRSQRKEVCLCGDCQQYLENE